MAEYQTRSPAKSTAASNFLQPNLETIKNTFPGKYLTQEQKYATFAKEFIFEAVWITVRNGGISIWHIPEYIEQVKGTLFMLEKLFTGKILPADFIVSLMENTVEGLGGDLFFVLTHLDWYSPNTQLTKTKTVELAKRTARAVEEAEMLALMIYMAAQSYSAGKVGTAAEGAGSNAGKAYSGTRNPASDFTNSKGNSTLTQHLKDHGADFGYTTEQQYLNGARNFLEKTPTSTTQSFVSSDSWYYRYDTVTNELGEQFRFSDSLDAEEQTDEHEQLKNTPGIYSSPDYLVPRFMLYDAIVDEIEKLRHKDYMLLMDYLGIDCLHCGRVHKEPPLDES